MRASLLFCPRLKGTGHPCQLDNSDPLNRPRKVKHHEFRVVPELTRAGNSITHRMRQTIGAGSLLHHLIIFAALRLKCEFARADLSTTVYYIDNTILKCTRPCKNCAPILP